VNFIDRLSSWHDSDQAGYELGVMLGLLPDDAFAQHKWVFWTNNQLGDALHQTLLTLAAGGLLIYDEDNDRFRKAGDPDVPWTLAPPVPLSET
jgi:hypothetical protein